MIQFKKLSRIGTRSLCVVLLLGSAGCARAVRAALGLAGIEASESPPVVTSEYQRGEETDWEKLSTRHFYYPKAESMLRTMHPGSCPHTPLGLGRAAGVPQALYVLPTHALQPLPVAPSFTLPIPTPNYQPFGASITRDAVLTASVVAMAPGCGQSIFVFAEIHILPWGDPGTPLLLLR